MIRPPPEPSRDREPIIPGLPNDRRRWLVEVVQVVIVAALLYGVVNEFVARPVRVELGSMEPGLMPGDNLLVDLLTPRWDPYARGEIIVFDPPPPHDADGVPYVKRVIGLPGDTVRLESGRIWVAPAGGVARPLDEPYAVGGPTLPQGDGPTVSWEVPEGGLFVLGDNRGASVDSRTFGPIRLDRVIGRAWVRYLPPSRIGILDSGD